MYQFSLAKPPLNNEEGKPWYDTTTGIIRSLTSLKNLNELIYERYIAGYKRKEKLNEFYILGRFHLDTCGNTGRLVGYFPKKELPEIPDVLSHTDFFEYISTHSKMNKDAQITIAKESGIPPDGIVCPQCMLGFSIENCHDVVPYHPSVNNYEVISLIDFVDKPLTSVKHFYGQKTDGIYNVDFWIRNDRHIDLSPKYPNPEEEWQKEEVKNKEGWIGEKDGVNDSYIIQNGDEGSIRVDRYYHYKCNRHNILYRSGIEYRKIFEKAGFTSITVKAIPNQYCSCAYCAPWFEVTTEIGVITFGWRKRVFNIDWSKVKKVSPQILSLFKNEDVTKDKNSIHAWGPEKATAYLSKIRKHVGRLNKIQSKKLRKEKNEKRIKDQI